jgi:hypothetical protein
MAFNPGRREYSYRVWDVAGCAQWIAAHPDMRSIERIAKARAVEGAGQCSVGTTGLAGYFRSLLDDKHSGEPQGLVARILSA